MGFVTDGGYVGNGDTWHYLQGSVQLGSRDEIGWWPVHRLIGRTGCGIHRPGVGQEPRWYWRPDPPPTNTCKRCMPKGPEGLLVDVSAEEWAYAREVEERLLAMKLGEWVWVLPMRNNTMGAKWEDLQWVIRSGDRHMEYAAAFGRSVDEALDDVASLWSAASGCDFWEAYHAD